MNTSSTTTCAHSPRNAALKRCCQARDLAMQTETRRQLARLLRGKYNSPECIQLAAQNLNQRLILAAGIHAYMQTIPEPSRKEIADYVNCIVYAATHGLISYKRLRKFLNIARFAVQMER
jgi:hypothetical protein